MASGKCATSGALTLTPEADTADEARQLAGLLGDKVGLGGLLETLPRQSQQVQVPGGDVTGFGWDDVDAETTAWWPQGLATSAEADTPVVGSQRTVVLAAWYARNRAGQGDVACRVSVLDLSDDDRPRYGHALLVDPHRRFWSRRRHRDVPVHAGGLVWSGNLLLVADTRRGMRVFDLRDLTRLPPGAKGFWGCDYVLPQRGRWLAGASGSAPLRWSFASLDRTDPAGTWLVAGEYSAKGVGARVTRLPLEPLLAGERAEAVEVLVTDLPRMQGVARVDGSYWVSTSAGRRHRGHLWTGRPGSPFTQMAEALPVGPEDVSYDPTRRGLWTQTEHPGQRFVFCAVLPAASRVQD